MCALKDGIMSRIFISHVERDAELLQQMQQGLEAAGYSTWFFERDVLPGTSYLIQITEAIEQCDAVVLIVSPNTFGSDQVTKEVVGAFEHRKPFFPVLVDVTPPELKQRQHEWRHALGGTAMITVGPEGLNPVITRIVEGLKAQGIQPEGGKVAPVVHGSVFTTPKTYTPKSIADKIMANRGRLEGERKQVTILFADVTGFTSMSERMDPEEVHELIAQCIDFMTEEIHRYEGTIAQFLGDGLMALFGAPIAHEDAPQRAIYASLAIQRHLDRYSEELKAKGIQFNMRIGLNTGLVIVGRIGDDFTMEYTAIGDTVNLASRMESNAEPGTIEVAESTYKLAEGFFDFEPLGEIQVKGKEEPVKAYRVLRPRPTRSRLTASLVRGLTPFVGRNKEMEHLTECFEWVKNGHGQLVGIVGEPGVGKSRVAHEFIQSLPEEEFTYLEGSCIHYGDSIAYLPILDIIRAYFDTTEGEREHLIKKKIEERLTAFDGQLKDVIPPIHDVLSLEVEDEEYLNLQPPQRRERTFDAIRSLLICESQNKPLVIAIEDLHWIDKTSEEFLSNLIGGLGIMNILLILLYRPEYTHAWGSKTYYSQIRIDELSQKTSAELVQSILTEGEVASELNDLILNRAAGNPLFIEEFTRNLIESGYIRKDDHRYVLNMAASDIQVPGTIQGIISGRMDRLEESLKQTMQVASVIGRDFSFCILQAVTGVKEELRSYLYSLQELEFIYEKSLFPELEYIFKHALTQEVAYNNLLLKKRRVIHGSIGQAIEELYPDRLEEFYEMLAHHYSKSENHEKAYQYLKLAGDKATRGYSFWETYRWYKQAIEELGRLPETDDNKRRGIEARLLIRYAVMGLLYLDEALGILQEGERLAEELRDDLSVAHFRASLGQVYSLKGDWRTGTEYLEEAFEVAERMGVSDLVATVVMQLCTSYFMSGHHGKAAELAPRAMALLEPVKRKSESLGGVFNLYCALISGYGYSLAMLGNFGQAEAECEKALRLATSRNDPAGIGYAEWMYGMALVTRGDGENAMQHLRNACKYAEETQQIGVSLSARTLLAGTYLYLGEIETAREQLEQILEHVRHLQSPTHLVNAYRLLATVYCESGNLEDALSCIEQVERTASDSPFWSGMSGMWRGRVLAKSDASRADEAVSEIRQGIYKLDELRLRPYSSIGYFYLGELYADTDQKAKALEVLGKAKAEFKDMGMDYWLRRTEEILASIQS
jgi:class 3 adenylate cyclase/tetratricopeptide (TPR) repeat protein